MQPYQSKTDMIAFTQKDKRFQICTDSVRYELRDKNKQIPLHDRLLRKRLTNFDKSNFFHKLKKNKRTNCKNHP